MESQAILQNLQPIFRDVFDDDNLTVDRQSNASTVQGWDSFAQINLVMSIEKDFGIELALGELEDLKNVGDMVDLIGVKLNRKK